MLYYQGYTVSFQEVPDEVSLVVLVADCPHKCAGCHSPMLQKPIGYDLERDLRKLIMDYDGAITCVCLMGEGRDRAALMRCAQIIHECDFKAAVYIGSGEGEALKLALSFDYVKYGPYIAELGGLDSKTTNQHMICVTKRFDDGIDFEDITWKFQKDKW